MSVEHEIGLPIDKEACLEEKTVQFNDFFCNDRKTVVRRSGIGRKIEL
jgi:hypothetical protein